MGDDARNGSNGSEDETTRRTVEDMAMDDDGDGAELFPLGSIEGDAKTLKSLIRPGQKTEQTVSMMGAEVPITKGGLIDPDKEGMLLVMYEAAGYTEVPVREGDRTTGKTVKSWKIRTTVRPIHVERVDGAEGEIEANYALLLDADEQRAGALLDKLKDRLAKKLADGKHPAREPSPTT